MVRFLTGTEYILVTSKGEEKDGSFVKVSTLSTEKPSNILEASGPHPEQKQVEHNAH